MQFSTKIDGFEQKDSQGFQNSYNSYEQYPLEKFFIFTIYQNYTFDLITKRYNTILPILGGRINIGLHSLPHIFSSFYPYIYRCECTPQLLYLLMRKMEGEVSINNGSIQQPDGINNIPNVAWNPRG